MPPTGRRPNTAAVTAPARGAGSPTRLRGGGVVRWRAAPRPPPRYRTRPGIQVLGFNDFNTADFKLIFNLNKGFNQFRTRIQVCLFRTRIQVCLFQKRIQVCLFRTRNSPSKLIPVSNAESVSNAEPCLRFQHSRAIRLGDVNAADDRFRTRTINFEEPTISFEHFIVTS